MIKKAAELFLQAAEQGYANAQYNLGWMYEYGRGVSKDLAKARDWYQRAAEQSEPLAQAQLSRLLNP